MLEPKKVRALAKIVHEANKAYCETLGDMSQKSWEDTPSDIQASTIKGVEAVIANPDILSEDIHNQWMDYKRSQGWVYGDIKDMDKKTHPCLVPYEDLPVAQRYKDSQFTAIIKNYLGFLG